MRFVGMDLHKQAVQVCILDQNGRQVLSRSVPCRRDTLATFAKEHLLKDDQVALEATVNTWAVVAVLEPFVGRVAVGNPLQIRAIAQAKVKTDKVDAAVLANLLRCEYLPEVWRPGPDTLRLRQQTGVRAGLVADRTRLKNRIHGVLTGLLIEPPEVGLFSQQGIAWVREVGLPEDARRTVDRYLRLLEEIDKELAELDAELAKLAHQDKQVKLLMTLPGVGSGVALALVAAFGDLSRFRDADHAASYLGLVPSTRQSGSRCYHGSITKTGNSHARSLLVQAAQHAGTHPGPIGAFFRRVCKRRSRNVAIVATARKLATIAYLILKHGEPYRYADPQQVKEKLAKVRLAAGGPKRKRGRAPQPVATDGPAASCLNRVYAAEGLPAAQTPEQLPPGERRAVAASGAEEFVNAAHDPKATARRKPGKQKVSGT
jgi:transposase